MKICTKCFTEKPLEDFYKGKQNKGGHRSYCKSCCNKMTAENMRKKSIKNKPLCKRIGCKNNVSLGRSKFCSMQCGNIVFKEVARKRNQKIYHTQAYRKMHREYMRRYNNIKPSNYRILE